MQFKNSWYNPNGDWMLEDVMLRKEYMSRSHFLLCSYRTWMWYFQEARMLRELYRKSFAGPQNFLKFPTYLVSILEDNPAVSWSKYRPCASCDADLMRTVVSTRWRAPDGIFCDTRAAGPRQIGRFQSRTSRNAWETAGSFLNRTPPPFRQVRKWELHGNPTEKQKTFLWNINRR